MTTLLTVADYVDAARSLLQDTVNAPYRYPTADLVRALNMAMLEARKLRPDLFITNPTVPDYVNADVTVVAMDQMYRVPVLEYIVGMAQLRDEEDTQDQRAAIFFGLFTSKMLGLV